MARIFEAIDAGMGECQSTSREATIYYWSPNQPLPHGMMSLRGPKVRTTARGRRRRLRSALAMFVLGAIGEAGTPSIADDGRKWDLFSIGMGGSLAGGWGQSSGFRQGLELTFAALAPIEIFPGMSAGATFRDGSVDYLYGEASVLLPVWQVTGPSIGVGGGRAWNTHGGSGPAGHLFVGLPLALPLGRVFPYVEPYYRVRAGFGDPLHEAGIYLKVLLAIGGSSVLK